MYHYLYKTTNNVNNKIYIGIHSTSNLDDGYLGSGVNLKRAFKEYGRENFTKEILEYFDDRELLDLREQEIVNAEFVCREETYNLKTGGHSGQHSEETKKLLSSIVSGNIASNLTKQKMSLAQKGKRQGAENPNFKGYYHTPWGTFESTYLAANEQNICAVSVGRWCKTNKDGFSFTPA